MTIAERVLDAHRRLAALIEPVTDAQVARPSALPGWTRGHVLAHLAGATDAMARQAEHEGELIEVYDGGRPGRNADIEANAGRTADEHRAAIAAAVARLTAAWAGVSDWDSPVTYRSGTLRDTALALWREVEIHARDLDLGPFAWSPEFCEHALDFLAARVPDGVRLTLAATDHDREWTFGEGEHVELSGALTDLTAWLAGREYAGPISGPKPELKPWP
ncbi:maleylpyruvate isomerase [Saccharothrix coeruleofusca]|uniref:maleylpyruvate isomerase family mycothiol-dependent enzyme n=1 Tax=Saccharothrix coeruleofusca TaxID=33919 RepID=UPI001AE7CB97|nr:maleylpyruvate isomerase family mycothiol-dependent enzyme [Saccharothrix coeruleofusca]MBP2334483.1 maleylpyruvate isomerase [Saccharothrix coeruleofusca]